MTPRSIWRRARQWLAGPALLAIAFATANSAHAVPSYARQTGQDCAACHIGAFGPQLTPYGIKFKIGGYTDSDGKAGKVPLSGMVVADYTEYKNDAGDNKSKTSLSEASIFLAGRLTDKIGSFTQVTRDGVEHHTSLDALDLRLADTFNVAGKEAVLGLSLNNKPTVQDPFNNIGAWSAPYTQSHKANKLGAEFNGVGGSEQKVLGLNAYTLIDGNWYGEAGVYNTMPTSMQSRLGSPRADGLEYGKLHGAPYYRLAYMQDLKTQAFQIGVFGFNGTQKNGQEFDDALGAYVPTFSRQRFRDSGVDGTYQFLGNRQHIFTVNGAYVIERSKTNPADGSDETSAKTKDHRLAASYFFQNTYGATVGLFKGTSSNTETGSTNRGVLYQLDWTPFGKEDSWLEPWANLRVGLQHISYRKYVDGGTIVTRPHDKDTTTLFAWTSF